MNGRRLNMKRIMKTPGTIALVLIFPGLCGCGDNDTGRVSVGGLVTLDGTPIAEGTITFAPVNGGPVAAAAITGGEYFLSAVDGPGPGKNTVKVVAFREAANSSSGNKTQPVSDEVDPIEAPKDNMLESVGSESGTYQDAMEQFVPERYNTKSTLSAELAETRNPSIDFQLTSP